MVIGTDCTGSCKIQLPYDHDHDRPSSVDGFVYQDFRLNKKKKISLVNLSNLFSLYWYKHIKNQIQKLHYHEGLLFLWLNIYNTNTRVRIMVFNANFSAISWGEQVNFQWDDDEVHFVLDQQT